MKARLAIIIVACLICSQANAGDYVLTVNGKQYEVDIGNQTSIKLSDGHNVLVTLDKKSIISFVTENFSFDHPSRVSPSRTDFGNDISQTMMASPIGTVVMVQEYTTINPSGLIDMILTELIKEEAQYGYNITKSSSTRRLSNGAELKGKMAISKYKGVEYTRYVLCYEARDAGVMIVTVTEKAAPQEDLAMIETFWKSLKITMK